jgi:hypothetical protein
VRKVGSGFIHGKKEKRGFILSKKQCNKDYYIKNRKKINKRAREWQKTHIEQCREYAKIYNLSWKIIIVSIYTKNKMCCKHCGYNKNIDALTIDHIYNDGYKIRSRMTGKIGAGGRYYREIFKMRCPDNLQILCANCNLIKKTNGGKL